MEDTFTSDSRTYRFGVYQLDLKAGELYKHGIRMRVQDQPLQVLVMLLERPGELVTREELRDRLWGSDTYVDFDHSLNISINKLREALGDSAATPRFIETLPRRGYRFVAPVSVEGPPRSMESSAASTSAAASLTPPAIPTEIADTSVPVGELKPQPSSEGEPGAQPKKKSWIARYGLIVAAVLVVAAWLGSWLWVRGTLQTRNDNRTRKMMLAVLPFDDLTGSANPDYFVAGLHDEMIGQLGRVHPSRLGVIARSSVAPYAGTRKTPDQIGRELHVDYLLDGSVRKNGNRYRITAELVQVADQSQLWSETYELTLGDMLRLQEDVAQRISQALTIEVLPEAEQELRQSATSNADAYEAYLKGRFLWYQETHPALEQALVEFQKSIQLDPNYAPAYVGMADSYVILGGYGFVPPEEMARKAKEAAARALELSPGFSDAYGTLGFAAFYYDWNWNEAERLFRRALDLNPNNQLSHEFYSSFLHAQGRMDEAEAENAIAKRLDPLSSWLYDDKGWMLLSRRNPQAAIAEFQRAIELNPKFPAAHLSLAVAYNRTGQYDKALAEVKQAEALNADPTRVLEILGSTQAASGDMAGARATLNRLLTGSIHGRVSPYSVALIYTAMGEKKEALDWLEKAAREKDTWIVWIKVLVEWDSLRSEPRFADLMRKMNM